MIIRIIFERKGLEEIKLKGQINESINRSKCNRPEMAMKYDSIDLIRSFEGKNNLPEYENHAKFCSRILCLEKELLSESNNSKDNQTDNLLNEKRCN